MKLPAWTRRVQPLDLKKIKTCFTPQVQDYQNMDAARWRITQTQMHTQKKFENTHAQTHTRKYICMHTRTYVVHLVCVCVYRRAYTSRCVCMSV